MKTLKLKNKLQANATLISNDFIDHHLAQANGEFVKVYLFLLRHLEDPSSTLTVSKIADCLNHTEKDIMRAFRYWEAAGVLSLGRETEGRAAETEVRKKSSQPSLSAPAEEEKKAGAVTAAAPAAEDNPDGSAGPVSDKAMADPLPDALPSSGSPAADTRPAKAIPLDSFKAQKELKSLLFIAEQYLGKTLTKSDTDAITYFYDTLGMSADLVEYLLETCAENGHKNMHYIQKVALSWADDGIETVAQARQRSMNYNKNCYTVLNAFGIKNRGPAVSEVTYIQKWTDEFGFTLDIIQEACSRTIAAIHQPSFEYADTILAKWHDGKVHHLKDIDNLDAAFRKEKAAKKSSAPSPKSVTKNLNNFERRTYDMDSLEAQLLNSN